METKCKSSFEACSIIEDFDDSPATAEDYIDAFQYLINTGEVWVLQGFYGRTAQYLIDTGHCFTPEK